MEDQNRRLVELYFEEINQGNLAILDELCSPGMIQHTTHSPQPIYGLDKIKRLAAGYQRAFPDLYYTLDQVVAEGDLVAVRWTAQGHHTGSFQGIPPTGRGCLINGMSIYRCENGQIVERWVQNDDLGMLGQFGVPRWALALVVLGRVGPEFLFKKLQTVLSKQKA